MSPRVLALLLLVACKESPRPSAPPTGATPASGAAAKEPPFTVAAAPPEAPCTAGAPCAITVTVTALRGFHVNDEYPTKLVMAPVEGVTADGPGAFARPEESRGTFTWTFRAARAGALRLTGELRFSVCDDAQCLIEARPVTVDVDVG